MEKIKTSQYVIDSVTAQPNHCYEVVMHYTGGRHLYVEGGQFVFIHTKEATLGEYHPFSVLGIENNGSILRLGIRIAGDYTKRLSQAHEGETIKIKGAYGHFVIRDPKKPVVAIGGGIGITPCINLLASLPKDATGVLIWSCKDHEDDGMFSDEVQRLQAEHPNIKVIYHYASERGFLNEASLKEYTQAYPVDMTQFYLCGPMPMMDDVSQAIYALGVPKKHLEAEGFIF